MAQRDWLDPLDTSFAQRVGGRWNPANSWATLYLSRDLDTARAQIARLLESSPVAPDDLADDAYDLIAVTLPAARVTDVVDIVSAEGVAGANLPATFPRDATGHVIPHATCQRIAQRAHDQGADGIEARSALAAISPPTTSELAWWPGSHRATQVGGRVPYGQWRSRSVSDPRSLFPPI